MADLAEWKFRHNLCDRIIKELMQDTDPRAASAIEHYRAQQAQIDAEITRLEREEREAKGEPEPEAVIVGLKPGQLFGEALG